MVVTSLNRRNVEQSRRLKGSSAQNVVAKLMCPQKQVDPSYHEDKLLKAPS